MREELAVITKCQEAQTLGAMDEGQRTINYMVTLLMKQTPQLYIESKHVKGMEAKVNRQDKLQYSEM